MTPQFNKEHWINQLKNEAGLSHIPYEELDDHKISFGLFDNASQISAKKYIDEQLKNIEEQYSSFDDTLEDDLQSLRVDLGKTKTKGIPISEFIADVEPVLIQLAEVPQQIIRSNMKYYDVLVGGNNFTVVINDHGEDWRITDQINHVKHTSFFIEERNPAHLTGYENIISYYQFANLIQSHIKKTNTDLSVYEKISQDINTVFDGIKLEGF
jgi:hypothetical protein